MQLLRYLIGAGLLILLPALACNRRPVSPDDGPSPPVATDDSLMVTDTDDVTTDPTGKIEVEVAAQLTSRAQKHVPRAISNKVVIEKFANGLPHSERNVTEYDDGTTVNDGAYFEWDENGKKYCTGGYAKGLRVGTWNFWYTTAAKAKTGNYKNGLPDGQWTYWNPAGAKEHEEMYRDGVRHGTWSFYNPSGHKTRQEEYVDGKRQGIWLDWYSNGQKAAEATFANDQLNGPQRLWHPNGKLSQSAGFKDGRRDGQWISWDDKGEKISDVTYRDGEVVHQPPQDAQPTGAAK